MEIGDEAAKGEGIGQLDCSVSWRASPAVRPWSESLESGHPVGTTRGRIGDFKDALENGDESVRAVDK